MESGWSEAEPWEMIKNADEPLKGRHWFLMKVAMMNAK